MPIAPTEQQIVAARRARLREWIGERFSGSQADYIREAAGRGERIDQSELSRLLADKSFGEKKARKLESQSRMPPGYLVHPIDSTGAGSGNPRQIFTAEQVAGADAFALQLAVQSFVTAMLNRVPGTAGVFRDYLQEAAKQAGLEIDSGLLASFFGIADEALDAEAAAAQALQRARAHGGRRPRK